jgi:hypothetical protein
MGKWVNQSRPRLSLYHYTSRNPTFVNPGPQRVRLTEDYDLFVAVCQGYLDLPFINAIEG